MAFSAPKPFSSTIVLACGAAILLISLGIRQSFGLFLWPICTDRGWSRETVSIALALQNLMWGFAQPFAGALADRFGAGKVFVAGGILYAGGLVTMALAQSPLEFGIGTGALIGLAQSCAGLGVVLGVVGESVPERSRSWALGVAGAGGSFGQFLMLPGAQGLIAALGWSSALLAFAVLAFLIAPLGLAMARAARSVRVEEAANAARESMRAVLSRAATHAGFWMVCASVFVCGFQTAFMMNHLPAYLIDRGLTAVDGMTALTLVGGFNIVGSYVAGWLGGFWSKRLVLAAIYAARTAGIVLFLLLPISNWSLWIFSALMGFAWLGTIPLSNALIAQVLGARYLATLFSLVFVAHQVGSFLGVWIGGAVFDASGSYAAIWWAAALLGAIAALACLPIDERPATGALVRA